jgi:cytochrome P450
MKILPLMRCCSSLTRINSSNTNAKTCSGERTLSSSADAGVLESKKKNLDLMIAENNKEDETTISKLHHQSQHHHQQEPRRRFERPIQAPASMFQTLRALRSKHPGDFFFENAVATGSQVFRLRLAPIPGANVVIVGDMRIAKNILCDKVTTKPGYIYSSYESITGKASSFSLSDNKKLYQAIHAKVIKPSFPLVETRRMNDIMESRSSQWIENVILPLAESQEPFDPFELCSRFIFDTYMESGFEYDANEEDFNVFKDELEVAFPFFLPFPNPFGRMHRSSTKQAKKAAKEFQKFGQRVLDSYRSNRGQKGYSNSFIKAIEDKDGPFSDDEERIAEIIDFMNASVLTTASFLSSMLVQLAQNPNVSDTFQKHLKNNRDEEAASKYLENIISETERLSSPSGAISSIRQTGRNFFYEKNSEGTVASNNDDVVSMIPKGSIVIVSKNIASKSPEIFSDPQSFTPERWNEASSDMVASRSFTMFSAGSRSCPGRSLAYDSMYYIMPKIMSKFSVKMETDGDFVFNGLMSHYQGTRLILAPSIGNHDEP